MAVVVAVIGQKGGSAKSSTARLLAVELAKRGRNVVVVDLDVAQRTATEWAAARALNGLTPAITVTLVDHTSEPDFRIPEIARDGADVIVADAPGWIDRSMLELARCADVCVIPSACSDDELRPSIRLYHELVAAGIPPHRIAIVLNRVGTEAESKRARIKIAEGEVPDGVVVGCELPEQPIYRSGHDGGQATSEVSSKGPREKALALAAELIARIDAAKPRIEAKRFKAGAW